MGYAINVPNGHHLLTIFNDLKRLRGLLGSSRFEDQEKVKIQLDQLIVRVQDMTTTVEPIFETKHGVQEKNRPRKVTKTNDSMVRQHPERYGPDRFPDWDRSDPEPSPTESERNNSDPDPT